MHACLLIGNEYVIIKGGSAPGYFSVKKHALNIRNV